MADARQFEKFIPPWQAWVEQRRSIWSHLHLSGLLLGEGDNWICVSLAMLLAEDAACRSPNGINPSWKGEVCAFRVAVPIAMLDALLAGLEAGEWPDSVIPGVPGRIRFNPVEGKRLEPSGEPRLYLTTLENGTRGRVEQQHCWRLGLASLRAPSRCGKRPRPLSAAARWAMRPRGFHCTTRIQTMGLR